MRRGIKGQTLSDDHRRKLSDSLMGHEVSEETREKMSTARIGMEFSLSHRHNISVGKSGYRWVTSVDEDQERQLPLQEAMSLVASGKWHFGRINKRWGKWAAS